MEYKTEDILVAISEDKFNETDLTLMASTALLCLVVNKIEDDASVQMKEINKLMEYYQEKIQKRFKFLLIESLKAGCKEALHKKDGD